MAFFADATDRHRTIGRLKISTACSVRRKLSRTLWSRNGDRIDFIFKIHRDGNFLSQAHILFSDTQYNIFRADPEFKKDQYARHIDTFFLEITIFIGSSVNFPKILNHDAGLDTHNLRSRHMMAEICKNILLNNTSATTTMEQIS